MKKIAAILIPLIVLTFLGFMIHRIIVAKQKADARNESKQKLPDFSFYNLNEAKTGSDNVIQAGKPVVIFYFNTDCDHCQYEARELNANISAFKNVQVLMVSFNTAAEIKHFSQTYGLDKQSGVTFLVDKDFTFTKSFGSCAIPTAFIYNADHRLVKEFYGEVKLDAIKKLI